MFGSICAQRDLELEIGFGSARVHRLPCARKSVRARARQTAGDIYSLRARVFLHLSWHLLRGLGLLMSMVTTSWRKKARRSGADAEE